MLENVNLHQAADRAVGGFSGGMKQRLGIAQALINDPALVIVDEPTAGLDPEERVRFRNVLSEIGFGKLVILSTHIVSDIESIATEIAVMKYGALLTIGRTGRIAPRLRRTGLARGRFLRGIRSAARHLENLQRGPQTRWRAHPLRRTSAGDRRNAGGTGTRRCVSLS